MKHLPGEPPDVPGVSFAADVLAMGIHGDVDSHIDALCHVSYNGTLYNGVAPDAVTSQGAQELSIEEFENLLHPAFEQDEWILIAVGAALGFLVGEMQVFVMEHLAKTHHAVTALLQ